MATPVKFIVGQTNSTADPVVEVQFPANAPAKPGNYEFELVVVDDLGVASAPVNVTLQMQGASKAVVRISDKDGKAINQSVFKVGAQIFLSAKESKTENGAIKSFSWTLKARP